MKRYALIIALLLSLIGSNPFTYSTEVRNTIKVRATILSVNKTNIYNTMEQKLTVKVMEGPLMGETITFLAEMNNKEGDIKLKQNMRIIIQLTYRENALVDVSFVDLVRSNYLFVLFILFFLCLISFGGFKGLRSFVALIVTGLCILRVYIPMIIRGYGFIASTIVVCFVITVASFIIISGFTKKSLSAILGTIGGTVASGILALFFGGLMQLNGAYDDTIQMLLPLDINLDLRGLLYSGITIGVLGGVMDVSMTITSVIYEIKKTNPNIRISTLILSGLSVGKDIMATTTNTLILAYAGTSMPLLFLFALTNIPPTEIVNSQYIAAEIVRALSGSIGLLLTIPITSIIAAINH